MSRAGPKLQFLDDAERLSALGEPKQQELSQLDQGRQLAMAALAAQTEAAQALLLAQGGAASEMLGAMLQQGAGNRAVGQSMLGNAPTTATREREPEAPTAEAPQTETESEEDRPPGPSAPTGPVAPIRQPTTQPTARDTKTEAPSPTTQPVVAQNTQQAQQQQKKPADQKKAQAQTGAPSTQTTTTKKKKLNFIGRVKQALNKGAERVTHAVHQNAGAPLRRAGDQANGRIGEVRDRAQAALVRPTEAMHRGGQQLRSVGDKANARIETAQTRAQETLKAPTEKVHGFGKALRSLGDRANAAIEEKREAHKDDLQKPTNFLAGIGKSLRGMGDRANAQIEEKTDQANEAFRGPTNALAKFGQGLRRQGDQANAQIEDAQTRAQPAMEEATKPVREVGKGLRRFGDWANGLLGGGGQTEQEESPTRDEPQKTRSPRDPQSGVPQIAQGPQDSPATQDQQTQSPRDTASQQQPQGQRDAQQEETQEPNARTTPQGPETEQTETEEDQPPVPEMPQGNIQPRLPPAPPTRTEPTPEPTREAPAPTTEPKPETLPPRTEQHHKHKPAAHHKLPAAQKAPAKTTETPAANQKNENPLSPPATQETQAPQLPDAKQVGEQQGANQKASPDVATEGDTKASSQATVPAPIGDTQTDAVPQPELPDQAQWKDKSAGGMQMPPIPVELPKEQAGDKDGKEQGGEPKKSQAQVQAEAQQVGEEGKRKLQIEEKKLQDKSKLEADQQKQQAEQQRDTSETAARQEGDQKVAQEEQRGEQQRGQAQQQGEQQQAQAKTEHKQKETQAQTEGEQQRAEAKKTRKQSEAQAQATEAQRTREEEQKNEQEKTRLNQASQREQEQLRQQGEQDKARTQAQGQQDTARTEQEGETDKARVRQEGTTKAENEQRQGETQAALRIQQGEQEAQAKKNQAAAEKRRLEAEAERKKKEDGGGGWLSSAWNSIKGAVSGLLDRAKSLWNSAVDFANRCISAAKAAAQAIKSAAMERVRAAYKWIDEKTGGILSRVVNAVKAIAERVRAAVDGIIQRVKNAIDAAIERVKSAINAAIARLKQAIENFKALCKAAWKLAGDLYDATIGKVVNYVKTKIAEAKAWLEKKINEAIDWVKKKYQEIKDAVVAFAKKVIEDVKNAVKAAYKACADALAKAGKWLGEQWDKFCKWAQEAFVKFWTGPWRDIIIGIAVAVLIAAVTVATGGAGLVLIVAVSAAATGALRAGGEIAARRAAVAIKNDPERADRFAKEMEGRGEDAAKWYGGVDKNESWGSTLKAGAIEGAKGAVEGAVSGLVGGAGGAIATKVGAGIAKAGAKEGAKFLGKKVVQKGVEWGARTAIDAGLGLAGDVATPAIKYGLGLTTKEQMDKDIAQHLKPGALGARLVGSGIGGALNVGSHNGPGHSLQDKALDKAFGAGTSAAAATVKNKVGREVTEMTLGGIQAGTQGGLTSLANGGTFMDGFGPGFVGGVGSSAGNKAGSAWAMKHTSGGTSTTSGHGTNAHTSTTAPEPHTTTPKPHADAEPHTTTPKPASHTTEPDTTVKLPPAEHSTTPKTSTPEPTPLPKPKTDTEMPATPATVKRQDAHATYHDAYEKAATDFKGKNPGASEAEIHAHAKTAGTQALKEKFPDAVPPTHVDSDKTTGKPKAKPTPEPEADATTTKPSGGDTDSKASTKPKKPMTPEEVSQNPLQAHMDDVLKSPEGQKKLYALAQEGLAEAKGKLSAITDQFPGSSAGALLKKDGQEAFIAAVKEKFDRKKGKYTQAGDVGDMTRGRINLEDGAQLPAVIEQVKKQFPNAVVDAKADGPYPRVHVDITLENGVKFELQVGTKATTRFLEKTMVEIPSSLQGKVGLKEADFHVAKYDIVDKIKDPALRAKYGLDEFNAKYDAALKKTGTGQFDEAGSAGLAKDLGAIMKRIEADDPAFLNGLYTKATHAPAHAPTTKPPVVEEKPTEPATATKKPATENEGQGKPRVEMTPEQVAQNPLRAHMDDVLKSPEGQKKLYALAQEGLAEAKGKLSAITDQFPGSSAGALLKKDGQDAFIAAVKEKFDRKKGKYTQAGDVGDMTRGRINLEDGAQLAAVVEQVKKQFPNAVVDAKADGPYPRVHVDITLDNGVKFELQVGTKATTRFLEKTMVEIPASLQGKVGLKEADFHVAKYDIVDKIKDPVLRQKYGLDEFNAKYDAALKQTGTGKFDEAGSAGLAKDLGAIMKRIEADDPAFLNGLYTKATHAPAHGATTKPPVAEEKPVEPAPTKTPAKENEGQGKPRVEMSPEQVAQNPLRAHMDDVLKSPEGQKKLYALAQEGLTEAKTKLAAISSEFPGSSAGALLKKDGQDAFIAAVKEKFDRKKGKYTQAGDVGDMTRGRINLEDGAQLAAVVEKVKQQFPNAVVDAKADGPYPRVHVDITLDNGVKFELQIGTKATTRFLEKTMVEIPASLQGKVGLREADFHVAKYDIVDKIKDPALRAKYGLDEFNAKYDAALKATGTGKFDEAGSAKLAQDLGAIMKRIEADDAAMLQGLYTKATHAPAHTPPKAPAAEEKPPETVPAKAAAEPAAPEKAQGVTKKAEDLAGDLRIDPKVAKAFTEAQLDELARITKGLSHDERVGLKKLIDDYHARGRDPEKVLNTLRKAAEKGGVDQFLRDKANVTWQPNWRGKPRIEDGNLKEGWDHIDARHVSGDHPKGAGDLFPPGTTREQIQTAAEQVVARGKRISDPNRRIQTFERRITVNGKTDVVQVTVDAADGRVITIFPARGGG